jgi:hypothetical protein
MQVLQAANRSSHDVLWKTPTRLAGEQPFRFLVGEAPYHPMTPVSVVEVPRSIVNKLFMTRKRGRGTRG